MLSLTQLFLASGCGCLALSVGACSPSPSASEDVTGIGVAELAEPSGDAGGETAAAPMAMDAAATGSDSAEGAAGGDWPVGWEPLDEFLGVPVETLRENYDGADGGRLKRLSSVKADSAPPGNDHGPEWTFWPNGHPRVKKSWVDGRQDGPFAEWSDGGILVTKGQFQAGKRDGVWEGYGQVAGARRWQYEYDAGKPHGAFKEWWPNGNPKGESHWDHGVQVGVEHEYNREGKSLREGNWQDGKRHGAWRESFGGGQPRLKGQYALGVKAGEWRAWHPNGELGLVENYRADILHGLQTRFRDDGTKTFEKTWTDGKQTGRTSAWFPNGTQQMTGEMVDGKRTGKWEYWNMDGTPAAQWSGVYENDEKVSDS